jgi:hypothetical protein
MIRLNGIDLTGMVWVNEYSSAMPSGELNTAVDGTSVFFTEGTDAFDIDLESFEDMGWITKTTADLLKESALQVGGVYQLEIRGKVFRVRFRHEEPPAIAFSPVLARSSYKANDYFYGTIKLRTV